MFVTRFPGIPEIKSRNLYLPWFDYYLELKSVRLELLTSINCCLHTKNRSPAYHIIQIFHCFEGNIPECLSRGSRESPRCYISRCRRHLGKKLEKMCAPQLFVTELRHWLNTIKCAQKLGMLINQFSSNASMGYSAKYNMNI